DWRALLVEEQLLEESPADALDRAAVHLGLDRGRINCTTDILDRDVANRCGVPVFGIDPHPGDVHGHARAVIRDHRLSTPKHRHVLSPSRREPEYIRELQGLARDTTYLDPPIHQLEIVHRCLEL